MRRKAIAFILALTGCTNDAGKVFTLYDANGLKIEREGVETRIYDLEGDAEYTFTSYRVRVAQGTAAQISEAKTTADTDTITIQTVHGLIIVTEKATGTTLYIKGAR